MARKVKELTIETQDGPAKITLVQVDGMAAGKNAPMIASLVVPVFTALGGSGSMGFQQLGNAAADLLQSLATSKLEELIALLFQGGTVVVASSVKSLDTDFIRDHLAGHSDQLYLLLWHAIQLNYANFFKPLQGKLNAKVLQSAFLQRMGWKLQEPNSTPTPKPDIGPGNV